MPLEASQAERGYSWRHPKWTGDAPGGIQLGISDAQKMPLETSHVDMECPKDVSWVDGMCP